MASIQSWLDLADTATLQGRRYKAHDVLFRQGEAVSQMFMLEAGRVQLVRYLGDGSSVTLHVARSGETFAEASLFAASYHCDAVAETDCLVHTVSKAELLATMSTNSEATLALAKHLAFQVRDLRAKFEVHNIRSLPDRLMAWMRMHAQGNPPVLMLDRNWTDIAAEVGFTREAIYRALSLLEKREQIRRTKGTIILVGEEKASKLARMQL